MGKKDKDKKEEAKTSSNATTQNSKDLNRDDGGRIQNTLKEISLQPVNAIEDFDYDTTLFR